jgi:flagellar hook-associated protein 2
LAAGLSDGNRSPESIMALSAISAGSSDAATMTSLGVGSGLPLSTILDELETSEDAALQPIQDREDSINATLSAYGKLQSALSGLQTAAQTLADTSTYDTLQASASSAAFTATVGSGAVAGQYSISIDQLASAQTLVSAGQASRTAGNGTGGTITLTLADGTSHTLDLTGKDTSLGGLASAINADSSLGVSATIINDGSSSPYHLLLIARQTGTQAAVTSIGSDNASLQSILGFTQGASSNVTETAASNALLQIDGIDITSQSNTVENAVTGLTLDLNAVDTSPATLALTHDDTQTIQAAQGLVTAYNNVLSTLQSLTAYDATTQTGSPLTGDPLALEVQERMFDALDTPVSGGAIGSLFNLGLSTDPTSGQLSLNADTLSGLLASDPGDVQSLLGGSTGIGDAFQTVTDKLLQSGGPFSSATTSDNDMLNDLKTQYEQTSDRIDTQMDTYRQQFTALDAAMAQMNSLSTYLTQQLSGLG